jgi:hypothetical protein
LAALVGGKEAQAVREQLIALRLRGHNRLKTQVDWKLRHERAMSTVTKVNSDVRRSALLCA